MNLREVKTPCFELERRLGQNSCNLEVTSVF